MPRRLNPRPTPDSHPRPTPEFRSRFQPGQRLSGDVGEGHHRRYTVVTVGPKWITLLDVSSVRSLEISRETLETNRRVRIADESNPLTVLEILASRVRERAALGMRMSTAEALRALDVLAEMSER